jgi:xylulokinase
MGDFLLGIDVGTASSKGVLLRPDGSLVADVRADHAMEVPRPGWAELYGMPALMPVGAF